MRPAALLLLFGCRLLAQPDITTINFGNVRQDNVPYLQTVTVSGAGAVSKGACTDVAAPAPFGTNALCNSGNLHVDIDGAFSPPTQKIQVWIAGPTNIGTYQSTQVITGCSVGCPFTITVNLTGVAWTPALFTTIGGGPCVGCTNSDPGFQDTDTANKDSFMLKLLITASLLCACAFAQCGKLVVNPVTGQLDCVGTAAAVTSNPFDMTSFVVRENWLSDAPSATNAVGTYGVGFSNTGGNSYTLTAGPDFNHHHFIRMGVTNTNNNDACYVMSMNQATVQTLVLAGLNATGSGQVEFGGVFRVPAITNVNVRIGLTGAGLPTCQSAETVAEGVYLRFSTGSSDTTWKFITSAASANTVTDTGVAVTAGTWYLIRIYINAANTWKVDITPGGGATTTKTNTTNISTAALSPNIYLKTLSTVANNLDILPPTVFDITGRIVP